jgi:hypothetical protein
MKELVIIEIKEYRYKVRKMGGESLFLAVEQTIFREQIVTINFLYVSSCESRIVIF